MFLHACVYLGRIEKGGGGADDVVTGLDGRKVETIEDGHALQETGERTSGETGSARKGEITGNMGRIDMQQRSKRKDGRTGFTGKRMGGLRT